LKYKVKGLKTVSGIEYRAKTVYRIVYNVNKIQRKGLPML